MTEPRACFVVPPGPRYVREERCQGSTEGLLVHGPRMPLELALYAALAERAGWTTRVVDAAVPGLDDDAALAEILAGAPDWIVLQATVASRADDLAFLARLKEARPGAITLAYGADFDQNPSRALARAPGVDALVHGDAGAALLAYAEQRDLAGIPGLVWRRGQAITVTPSGGPLPLASLPWPARHLLDQGRYVRGDVGRPQTVVLTAKGCPMTCSYCLVPVKTGRYYEQRPAKDVVDEVVALRREHGIRDVFFHADTFTLDRACVLALCEDLRRRVPDLSWTCNSRVDTLDDARAQAMKAAGCGGVSLGLEGGTDETLERVGKRATTAQGAQAVATLRRTGLLSLGYLMIGFPWEDEAAVRASYAGFVAMDPDLIEIEFPYPFPGTRLHDEMRAAGLIDDVAAMAHPPPKACAYPAVGTATLSPGRLQRLRAELLARFYLRPRSAGRVLRHLATAGGLRRIPGMALGALKGLSPEQPSSGEGSP